MGRCPVRRAPSGSMGARKCRKAAGPGRGVRGVLLDFGPEGDDGRVREPRRPLPGSDRGSAERLKAQNGFDSPAS